MPRLKIFLGNRTDALHRRPGFQNCQHELLQTQTTRVYEFRPREAGNSGLLVPRKRVKKPTAFTTHAVIGVN
jgi:hypothetical protein